MSSIRYQFADYTLDPSGVLSHPTGEVQLRPRTFDLLHTLVSQPDRVLGHDQLLNEVWGVEHLSASSLKQGISELRKALQDDSGNPRFIQTVPRRGYRFVAPVEVISIQEAPPTTQVGPLQAARPGASGSGSRTLPTLAFGLAGTVAALLLLVAFLFGRASGPTADTTPPAPASAEPSNRPTAAMIGFRSSGGALDPRLADLAAKVSTALVGSGTEQPVPFQLVERVRTALRTDSSLARSVQAVGDVLGIDMLAAGSVQTNPDGSFDAQLALFDTRTGQVGAHSLVRDASFDELRLAALRLINELWEWNGDLASSAQPSLLPAIDLRDIEIRSDLSTGLVVRRLRLSMATHARSGATRPPVPQLAE